jgi:hypothetical protein
MSKRLIVCMMNENRNDIDFIKSIEIKTKLSAVITSIEEKECSGFTTSFDKGGQHIEMLAYSVMTIMDDEDIKKLIKPICENIYNVYVLK